MGINEEFYKEKRTRLMQYLKQLFQSHNITQDEAAEETGFTQNNISRMLSGKYSPSLDNLVRLAEVAGYDVAFVKMNENTSVDNDMIVPKFMITVDTNSNRLYILHRQFPACLIEVVQQTPMRFVVQDLYDAMSNPADILNMPFVEEAKAFFRNYAESTFDKN